MRKQGGIFARDRIVAGPNFNRWWVPPASITIHLCIGSVYAWSIFNPALVKILGVGASAADDWSLSQVVWIFSVAIVFLGLAAAFAGKWLEEVGPRVVGFVAACLWGGGFIIGGLGITLHELSLVYLGYGVFGGCGLGLGYVSPVSTLIKWFPDRRGMATGMAIMGFGGGAMIGAPMIGTLLDCFYQAPTYLGLAQNIQMITEDGIRMAMVDGIWQQVVVVSAEAAAAMPVANLAGVYLVGTGSIGAAETFFSLGILYFIVMTLAAFSYRIPATDWKPEGWVETASTKTSMITRNHVHIDRALVTPQFYLLWVVLCFNVTAGIGVLGVAKTMMGDIFSTALPMIVTAGFAATYVTMISLFNMVGRFFWASLSDYIGRKNTYFIFFTLGIILYLVVTVAATGAPSGGWQWLALFYVATMIIFTMYGGGFATIPAYLADIFGTRYVGGIHGRLLTAWSSAGVLGPWAITYLRELTRLDAIRDLSDRVDDMTFLEVFGAPKQDLNVLVEAKTVTIKALMDLVPLGTVDPTPTLYNTTMYVMAGLLVIAWVANWAIKPVNPRHYMKD